ncbi:eL32 family ribosomal protein [Candidatus Micrarchaeota archaeon]|nr:eL32 family ribosomal protein [Candidatus Micrarchaeota archaeon]
MIKEKKKPSFRGRFGKKWLRRKKKEKWNKWRKPRGIDIKRKKEDGAIPKSGYRTRKKIRFVHPSGMNEVRVQNVKELAEVKKGFVVRIGGKVGKKNKKIMVRKAKEMGLRVLN